MDTRRLELFVAVADSGGVTHAAKWLGIAQSSVSVGLRALEAELGKSLFLRTGRALVLTDAGRSTLAAARALIHDAEALRESTAGERTVRPDLLRLGLEASLRIEGLPAAIAAMGDASAGFAVQVESGSKGGLMDRLGAGDLDLAVVTIATSPPDGLIARVIRSDRLVLAVSAGTRTGRPLAVEELSTLHLLDVPDAHPVRAVVDGMFQREQVARVVSDVVPDVAAALALARAGVADALVPLGEAADVPGVDLVVVESSFATWAAAIVASRAAASWVDRLAGLLTDQSSAMSTIERSTTNAAIQSMAAR